MKRLVALFILAFSLVAGTAFAACTAEEAQAKATVLQSKIMEVSQKDPQKVAQLAQEMQERAAELQKNPSDMDLVCKYYDEMISKLK